MNDNRFLDANRTGLFKRMQGNHLIIPKEIRENNEIEANDLLEVIPMREGFYVRKARGQRH